MLLKKPRERISLKRETRWTMITMKRSIMMKITTKTRTRTKNTTRMSTTTWRTTSPWTCLQSYWTVCLFFPFGDLIDIPSLLRSPFTCITCTHARAFTDANIALEESFNPKKQPENTGGWGDRANRATNEQVLDPRTRLILQKLLNTGVITAIHGCMSTGKEANVYSASAPDGSFYAIKVLFFSLIRHFSTSQLLTYFTQNYKTSILVFKDRERYVAGEFRHRKGFCKSNPRKMVQVHIVVFFLVYICNICLQHF